MGRYKTHINSPQIGNLWQTVQIPPKSNLVNVDFDWGFIWVAYRNMGEALLIGAEVTQRHLPHSPMPTPAWVMANESWKPGVHCTTSGSSTGWRKCLVGSSKSLPSIWTSRHLSGQLSWSLLLLVFLLLHTKPDSQKPLSTSYDGNHYPQMLRNSRRALEPWLHSMRWSLDLTFFFFLS